MFLLYLPTNNNWISVFTLFSHNYNWIKACCSLVQNNLQLGVCNRHREPAIWHPRRARRKSYGLYCKNISFKFIAYILCRSNRVTNKHSHLWLSLGAASGGEALRLRGPQVRAGGRLVPPKLQAEGREESPMERSVVARPLGATRLLFREEVVCTLQVHISISWNYGVGSEYCCLWSRLFLSVWDLPANDSFKVIP